MDLFVLNLGSKWMKKLGAKLIMRYIRKHFECNTELKLEELKISYVDGDVVINTNLEMRMKKDDVQKILSKLDDGEF